MSPSEETLSSYLRQHVVLGETPAEGTVDVIHFHVGMIPEATAEALVERIKAHRGVFCQVDLFDGLEHNYLELGGWIGDQQEALALMGLGKLLGLWRLITPRTLLGNSADEELVRSLAGLGAVLIQAPKETTPCPG